MNIHYNKNHGKVYLKAMRINLIFSHLCGDLFEFFMRKIKLKETIFTKRVNSPNLVVSLESQGVK